jgi:hypothetical protein
LIETLMVHEIIGLTIDLTGSRSTGRGGHRIAQTRYTRSQSIDEGIFARSGWAGYDKQETGAVQRLPPLHD